MSTITSSIGLQSFILLKIYFLHIISHVVRVSATLIGFQSLFDAQVSSIYNFLVTTDLHSFFIPVYMMLADP